MPLVQPSPSSALSARPVKASQVWLKKSARPWGSAIQTITGAVSARMRKRALALTAGGFGQPLALVDVEGRAHEAQDCRRARSAARPGPAPSDIGRRGGAGDTPCSKAGAGRSRRPGRRDDASRSSGCSSRPSRRPSFLLEGAAGEVEPGRLKIRGRLGRPARPSPARCRPGCGSGPRSRGRRPRLPAGVHVGDGADPLAHLAVGARRGMARGSDWHHSWPGACHKRAVAW